MLKLKAHFLSMSEIILEQLNQNHTFLMENTSVVEEMKQVEYEHDFSDMNKQQKDLKVFLKIMNIFESKTLVKIELSQEHIFHL